MEGTKVNADKTDNFLRVYHGGSWHRTDAVVVGTTFHTCGTPAFRGYRVGFRTTLRGREPIVAAK